MQTIIETARTTIYGIEMPAFRLDSRSSLVLQWPCHCDHPAVKQFTKRLVATVDGVRLHGASAKVVEFISWNENEPPGSLSRIADRSRMADALEYLESIGRPVDELKLENAGHSEKLLLRMLLAESGSIGMVSTQGLDPLGRCDVAELCQVFNRRAAVGWLVFEFALVGEGNEDGSLGLPTVRARWV